MTKHPGDSSEQQEVEEWLVAALSKKLGITLSKKRWPLDEGSWIEIDGYSQYPQVLCEAWAHIGVPKPAQKNKVMTDAFKLLFINRLVEGGTKKILLFADHEAAAHFQGKSWMAQCLKYFDIIIEIIDLPPDLKTQVLKAQQRQYR